MKKIGHKTEVEANEKGSKGVEVVKWFFSDILFPRREPQNMGLVLVDE